MDSPPENFESLQKLLRLKRYEQPPPRYFNEFSGRVIARIQSEHVTTPRWWHRFGFDLRPAVSVGIGAFACVLLFLGITSEPDDAASVSTAAAQQDLFSGSLAGSSTNPVNAAGTMLINPFRPRIVPANYQR